MDAVSLNWADTLEKVALAAGGYVARLLQTIISKRRMRRQLYREICRNYHKLDLQINLGVSRAGLAQATLLRFTEKLDISFDVWNFYNDETRRASLFEITEADAIARIYVKFTLIGNDLPGYAHVRAKAALAEIDDRLLDRSLSRRIFRNVSTHETRPFVDDLVSGKRKPYRDYLNPL
jgi:hypothetical protein